MTKRESQSVSGRRSCKVNTNSYNHIQTIKRKLLGMYLGSDKGMDKQRLG